MNKNDLRNINYDINAQLSHKQYTNNNIDMQQSD